jgi:hypothetical protein
VTGFPGILLLICARAAALKSSVLFPGSIKWSANGVG